MEKYNYWKETANDIYCWMNDCGIQLSDFNDKYQAAEYIEQQIWNEDIITGNGDSWYEKEKNCEEYLCHNIDLAFQACEDLGVDFKTLRKEFSNGTLARYLDCTIRCYVLMTAIYDALTEREQNGERYIDIS